MLQWLMWQMSGLGPMAGQVHHFCNYAPEKLPYAMNRYLTETKRLYGVLERRLADRAFVAGDYGLADMAIYPWVRLHDMHHTPLDEFPNIARWCAVLEARPAVIRAYEIAAPYIERSKPMDDEAKTLLFNQTAESTRARD
jgi:GSH-dependent disulfide-bond oxidoreductase